MSNDYHIFCGGLVPDAHYNASGVLRLNLWGGGEDENVQLRIEDLHATLWRDIPQQFFDLVEIAAYVYCADQAVKRTGQDTDTFGDDWRRNLHFHIPVRCIDLWNRKDIKEALIQVLNFLSDDHILFSFHQAEHPPEFQQYLGFAAGTDSGRSFERVVMFSGGLDSLAGVIEETLVNKSRIVVVTHESTPKNSGLLRELQRLLAEKAGPLKPLHLRVRANKKKRIGKEYTQRTRSFLFACFGVTVAKMMGLDTLRFYENGVVSLNLPVSAQVIGARATRTTHPRTLAGFQKLFSLVGAEPFTVENPFLWATKADVIQKITRESCGDMIRASTSCAHTWERSKEFTHCGTCSQCIDRRLAVAAAHAEVFDPGDHYRTNIFVDPQPADEDKMILAAYLDRATAIDEIPNIAQFIAAFPQVTDSFPFVPGGPTKVAAKFFDIYKRHAKEVSDALDIILREHSNYLVRGEGGAGCLLRTLTDSRGSLPQQANTKASEVAPYRVRFRGDDWVITFNAVELSVKDSVGMRYIAFLLQNPGQEFRHTEIKTAVYPPVDPIRASEMLQTGLGKGIPVTDEKTTQQIKGRLLEIEEEKEAARTAGDFAKLDDLGAEEERLVAYKGSTTDKRGKSRLTKGIHESTRVSVLKALKKACTRIGKTQRNKPFFEHLKAIRPGVAGHLVYLPSPPVDWTFEDCQKSEL